MNTVPPSSATELSREELFDLCAGDSILFEQTFFPKTVRQATPPFARDVWAALESSARLVNIQMFRGSAKTTRCRMFAAKRIGYGLAHTILYIGLSQDKAIQSVRWLRRQIEFNRPFAETFGLRPGKKWQDVECEIVHELLDYPITVLAYGVTGSLRGVNLDDYRPDLIIGDDILNEENTATPEQRKKVNDLIYGAIINSLAPETEAPDAKFVMTQTPFNREDPSTKALNDPGWLSLRVGCFTPETANLELEAQRSIWEDRFTTESLRRDKRNAIARNASSTWYREMECRIVAPENTAFLASWLQYYTLQPPIEQMQIVCAIDPVPPPSETQIAQGMAKKDYEAFVVIGLFGGKYYLLEYSANRGHEPEWTVAEFFRLGRKWRPQQFVVETVAYQRTLVWILKRAMQHQRTYFVVNELSDKRSKYDRIRDAYSGPASQQAFYVKQEHSDFIDQFSNYPDVTYDDILDAGAMAVTRLTRLADAEGEAESPLREFASASAPRLEFAYGAP
ncbi:MAG: hypothetical protein OXL41_03960 [Nitrospinae bacterium]|nr:hypothetical protein [Nitrospinota bacterium]